MTTIDICCEYCLEEFQYDNEDSDTKVVCPYCRQWTRTNMDEEEEIYHNWR